MNIGIELNKNDFMYDIHSLVKSFFPDDGVTIYTDDDEKAAVVRDILFKIEIPAYGDRAKTKNELKLALYETLCDYTGRTLPWGTLSGIRPTKIPMKLLGEGKSRREIHDYMKETYRTSDSRIALATEVAEKERACLAPIPLGDSTWSLYVHIPFCPTICLYCTFASSPYDAFKKQIPDYLDAVIAEMKDASTMLAEKGMNPGPTTIYLGGGTPTALSADELDRLLAAIESTFSMDHVLEKTVEAGRPDSLTPEKMQVLVNHGVTRISINPQTMNQKTLDLIGRRHTVEDVEKAFSMARQMGFANINTDMILGLPGEEEADVRHTLDAICAMKPDSLTVHSLAVKRASRLRKTILEDRLKDAGADYGNYGGLVFENDEHLMNLASEAASDLGMEPYYLYRQKNMRGNLENTGFAVPGRECLYNILIMEEMQSILAFGAGASTKRVLSDGRIDRVVAPKNLPTYLAKVPTLCQKKRELF
ncbi:MAG: coproporphyrinogen dehydrogenase HemZ [Lachnospiraceae bacterium]|nr:coproporphyrinogen dehydrogenase HemZ [Lachnospiraceae bacterium]